MRIFITGWDGLLGSALVPVLASRHAVEGFGIADADLSDRPYIRGRLERFRPEATVHLAAMTAVDDCEADPDAAFRVNREGTRIVAEETARVGSPLLVLSTDYVFDGALGRPYREDDGPRPLSVYGKSKLAAEEAARVNSDWTVVRSAWLFGPRSPGAVARGVKGRTFVDAILARFESGQGLRVVTDQIGSPTYAPDLARGLARLLEVEARGLYHLVNKGEASWWDLAREVVRLRGGDPEQVLPATTEEIGRPAPRPAYSVLDAGKAAREFGLRLRPWAAALAEQLVAPSGAGEAAPHRTEEPR